MKRINTRRLNVESWGSPMKTASYAPLKRKLQSDLVLLLRAAGAKPGMFAGERVTIGFEWHESDRRRDPCGIDAGGRKLVLDALAPTSRSGPGLGVIHCDGHHCIAGIDAVRFVFPDDPRWRAERPGVRVAVFASDGYGSFFWLPIRLPDLNELLSAREHGARRFLQRQRKDPR